MTNLKFQFQNEINNRANILKSIYIQYDYGKYLFENYSGKRLNDHWARIQFNFFAMLFIDLAKLYVKSNNHKFNLIKLLEDLETNKFDEFNSDKDKIIEFKKKLTSQIDSFNMYDCEKKVRCCGIRYYRDKIFAHHDIMAFLVPSSKLFLEIEKLIIITLEIMNYLSKIAFKRDNISFLNTIDFNDLNVELKK